MTAPSNANTSGLAPTDALRLVPLEPTEAMIFAGALAAMEAATEFMDDDFWKERHLAAIERMKSGDYGSEEERAKAIKVGSTLFRAMLAAAPASPLPEGGGDILWMMHVRGPDDIYPAPDYDTAVAWCDYVNDVLAKAVPEVMTKAVPAIWTLSPQEHAAYLPEAIKGWALPADPTGDRP